VRIISILAILANIREGQNIELCLPSTACRVDRKENRESQTSFNKTDDRQHLEKSKIQISVERLMAEYIFVRNTFEASKPVEFSFWQILGLFSVKSVSH
jgi:hypothetical protein